jgi:hypothetical protein
LSNFRQNRDGSTPIRIPQPAKYLRRCFQAFHDVGFRQDTTILDRRVLAESVFYNHRFTISGQVADHATAKKWMTNMGLRVLADMVDELESNFFDDEDIFQFAIDRAPKKGPSATELADQMVSTWGALKAAIPTGVAEKVCSQAVIEDGGRYYLSSVSADWQRVARAAEWPNGEGHTFWELWLDVHAATYETGIKIKQWRVMQCDICEVTEWALQEKEYTPPERESQAGPSTSSEIEKEQRKVIAGPITRAFPAPDGWSPELEHPDPAKRIKGLPDATINNLTAHFTHCNNLRVPPNCQKAWSSRLNLPRQSQELWGKIWNSLGTDFSDATEEKQWRKMVHRAIFVRNRTDIPDPEVVKCRLCGGGEESMLHIVTCPKAALFWDRVFHFLASLGKGHPRDRRQAVILNVWAHNELADEQTRAILRHAFGAFYRDFTLVETLGIAWEPVITYARAIDSFSQAVQRYGMRLRKHHLNNKYSTRECGIPEKVRERHSDLIEFDTELTFSRTAALIGEQRRANASALVRKRAIRDAKAN